MISLQKYFKNFKFLETDYGQPDVAMLYAKKIIIEVQSSARFYRATVIKV